MTIEVPSFLITIHNTHASLVSAYDLSYFVCTVSVILIWSR